MNPLQYIEEPLTWLLDFLHEQCNLTYGWAIVVLTVMVRTALLPLVVKQYRSMREMQRVAPQIKELQRKYKGNRQKLNEEMMKFYRENEVNPFASCLPLVFQLPVFFALYYVLRDFAESGKLDGTDPSFMWVIPDISERITEIGWGAAIVLGVYGLSQLISTELSATPQMPDIQRRLFRFLPVIIISSFYLPFFQFPLPAGLVLYWATTNLWTAGQQLIMRHRIGLHLATPDGAPVPTKRSSRTPPKERTPQGATAVVDETEDDMAVEEPTEAIEAGAESDAPGAEAEVVEPTAADGGDGDGDRAEPAQRTPTPATGAGGGTPKRRQPRPKGSGGRGGRKQPRRRR